MLLQPRNPQIQQQGMMNPQVWNSRDSVLSNLFSDPLATATATTAAAATNVYVSAAITAAPGILHDASAFAVSTDDSGHINDECQTRTSSSNDEQFDEA
jgi:hypothetical protein